MSEKKATRRAYGEYLVQLGKRNPQIVVLDADLAVPPSPNSSRQNFRNAFLIAASPKRT